MGHSMSALAYHLTWTTYGTWLPGDARGWVKKNRAGIQLPDPELENRLRKKMKEAPVVLDSVQRALVERTIQDHCTIRRWILHALNARSNHVHVVVTADREPDEVMSQFKAWCARKLSDAAGLRHAVAKHAGWRRWFTEDGDKELIEDELYLTSAIRYVTEGQ